MSSIDADFPVFVLCSIMVERSCYAETIVPAFARFKMKYWTHEGVNLHSRDIRKSKGPYGFMTNPEVREAFLSELSILMKRLPYTAFVCAIRKDRHLDRYGGNAMNPYELALEFTMERISHFLMKQDVAELPFVAEARGKNEDADLERVFYRILSNGTLQMKAARFRMLNCSLVFRRKFDNIAGIQLADLCAHPCARYILKPKQVNQAYNIVKGKLYNQDGVSGWKVFP